MVDSSSWTIPDSESGGCQLGILEEFLLEAKSKMATGDYVLRNIFASKPIRNTILVSTSMLSYEKWRFRSQFRHGYEIPHYMMLCW